MKREERGGENSGHQHGHRCGDGISRTHDVCRLGLLSDHMSLTYKFKNKLANGIS